MNEVMNLKTVSYENNELIIIDTTQLPKKLKYVKINNVKESYEAIKTLQVRGAPAIGVMAGYALVLSANAAPTGSFEDFYSSFKADKEYLASSRPTAVNLFWALDRVDKKVLENKSATIEEIKKIILSEAHAIQDEDIEMCKAIGLNGLGLLKDGMTILTHCNTGVLAASKYGTAIAPVYLGQEQGKNIKVFCTETRPLQQGSRLTAYELHQSGVDVTLICDSMVAMVMAQGKIDAVFLGCDRIAANGDVANKIGTYSIAVLAKYHNIPIYSVGPTSTIDVSIIDGSQIEIEERAKEEITCGFGVQTAPLDVKVFNPAFDVTPNHLLTGIITEKGVVSAPFVENISKLFK